MEAIKNRYEFVMYFDVENGKQKYKNSDYSIN